MADESPFLGPVLGNPETIQLEAGRVDIQFGDKPAASMSGGVLLRRDDKLAGADSARYDPDQRALFLKGGVRYEDPNTQILSRSAEFGYDRGRVRFEGAEFSLGTGNARGEDRCSPSFAVPKAAIGRLLQLTRQRLPAKKTSAR